MLTLSLQTRFFHVPYDIIDIPINPAGSYIQDITVSVNFTDSQKDSARFLKIGLTY